MKAALLAFIVAASPAFAIEMCGSGKRVTCIVDGDTFWLQGEKFRMVGYDTPEPHTNICGGQFEKELARKASRRLLDLFNEKKITIRRRGKDKYGRTLAVVLADGKNVGAILIKEGLARKWPDGCEFWCRGCN